MKNTVHRLMVAGLALLLVLTLASTPWARRNARALPVSVKGKEVHVVVPVRGTFLRAIDLWPYVGPGTYQYDTDLGLNIETSGQYRVEQPAIVDLEASGFVENEKVKISYIGTVYDSGAWVPAVQSNVWEGDTGRVIALFSATPDLESIGQLHRVPGATNFGEDVTTDHTYWPQNWSDTADALAAKGVTVGRGGDTDIPEDFVITPYTGMRLQIPENARYLFICINDSYYPDNTGGLTVTIEKDTRGAGGVPFWVWIIVGVGTVAVIGSGILLWRRLAKKPVAAG